MFLEDDELFGGSPKKKYFDIIFNANQNLVQDHLEYHLSKMAALELMLEEMIDQDVTKAIKEFQVENKDKLNKRVEDLYIEGMSDILSKNE